MLAARIAGGRDEVRTAPEFVGHGDVSTTMVRAHVLNPGPGAVRSPADSLVADVDGPPSESPPRLLPRYTASPRSLTPRRSGERP